MEVETSLGIIPVFGKPTGRLSVLVITGAWAHPETGHRLGTILPEYDFLIARLPGNRSPELAETSIAAWASAFDELADQLRVDVVAGFSVGALVALAMRSPSIKAVVSVEPPLRTRKLWPLFELIRERPEKALAQNIFGVFPDHIEERDYTAVIGTLKAKLVTLVGSDALYPERGFINIPSLVDEPERSLCAARGPLIVVPGCGHDVPFYGRQTLLRVLKAGCERIASERTQMV